LPATWYDTLSLSLLQERPRHPGAHCQPNSAPFALLEREREREILHFVGGCELHDLFPGQFHVYCWCWCWWWWWWWWWELNNLAVGKNTMRQRRDTFAKARMDSSKRGASATHSMQVESFRCRAKSTRFEYQR
jgi:hypothetical protein